MGYITPMEKKLSLEPSTKRAFLIILLLGLAVRLVGLPFGLPYLYHVDEARFAKISLNYFTGDLNPHFFHVPTLHTYLVTGVWFLYYHIGKILGHFTSISDFMKAFDRDPTLFILLGRLLTIMLSVATIALVFIIGTRMYNRRVGIFAALFMIFAHDPNKISHYQVPDAPMIFFFMLSFLFIWQIYRRGKTLDYILAGFFAGLAMATKYGGQLLFLPLLLAHIFRKVEEKKPLKNILFSLPLILSGIFFLAGFFIGCPYFLLDFASFWKGFRWQSQHLYVAGHFGSSTNQPAWLFYLQYGFRENVGILSQFLVLGGTAYGLIRHKTREILLISLPLALFIIIGSWKTMAVRYMLPMVPFLVLIAAYCLDVLLKKIESHGGKTPPKFIRTGKRITALSALIVLLILIPSAYRVMRFDLSLTQADTRTSALRWIEKNIPEGSHISREMYTPSISDTKYHVHYRHTLGQVTLEYLAQRKTEFVIVSDIMYSRFLSAPEEFPKQSSFYRSLDEQAVLIKTFEPRWNEKLIDLHNPTLKIYKLSSYSNYQYPGNFRQYAQKIVITQESENTWKLQSALIAHIPLEGDERVENPYVRLIDSQQREIAKLIVYEGNLCSAQDRTLTKATTFTAPLTEWEIRLGYEYSLVGMPSAYEIAPFLNKEFVFAEKINTKIARFHRQEFLFQYTVSPNPGDSQYFQFITISQIGRAARLFSQVFGSELRWGDSYVENPFVQVQDSNNRELAKLIIFEGRIGGTAGKRGQTNNAINLPYLPEQFRIYAGFEFFHDSNQPCLSGGPTRCEVIVPKESEPSSID